MVILYAAFQLWSYRTGAAKFEPVAATIRPDGRLSAEIVLKVAPERFHIEMMQNAGRVVEIRGHSFYVADIPTESARSIARNYWVEALRPWTPAKS